MKQKLGSLIAGYLAFELVGICLFVYFMITRG
jgi:hypothetical protein